MTVFKSNSKVKPVPVYAINSVKPECPLKYKFWDEDQMPRALEAVIVDHMSVRQASLRFNVPKSTLGDRVCGRVLPGTVSGLPKYLSAEEENELVRFLIQCFTIGYPKTRQNVVCLVQSILESRGTYIATDVTGGWWESFCRRHPDLALRAPAPLSKA